MFTLLKILPIFLSLSAVAGKYDTQLQQVNVKSFEGNQHNLAIKKQPIIIINFWASWCAPCIKEFKSINMLIKTLGKDKVFVLGVNNDDEKPEEKIKKIKDKYKLLFESVQDSKSKLTDLFMVSRIPTTFVFVNRKLFKHETQEFDFMNEEFLRGLEKQVKNL